jgi:hypothetical protein
MYGLFTRIGAGAVISAGLSVLGISYLCTEGSTHNSSHEPAAAVAAIHADAGVGVSTAPSSHGPGASTGSNAGTPGSNSGSASNPSSNPGSNPGSASNPGSSSGSNNPGCGCNAGTPIVNVKPDVDADVNVVVKLPDPDLNASGLVNGAVGTVNGVVDGVLPDCGCSPGGPLVVLPLPVLGH